MLLLAHYNGFYMILEPATKFTETPSGTYRAYTQQNLRPARPARDIAKRQRQRTRRAAEHGPCLRAKQLVGERHGAKVAGIHAIVVAAKEWRLVEGNGDHPGVVRMERGNAVVQISAHNNAKVHRVHSSCGGMRDRAGDSGTSATAAAGAACGRALRAGEGGGAGEAGNAVASCAPRSAAFSATRAAFAVAREAFSAVSAAFRAVRCLMSVASVVV